MTDLLREAVAEAEKLPADEQDALAARLLAEVEDEREWAARFAATTDAQWNRLADRVRAEIASGDVTPLEDIFPPRRAEG